MFHVVVYLTLGVLHFILACAHWPNRSVPGGDLFTFGCYFSMSVAYTSLAVSTPLGFQ